MIRNHTVGNWLGFLSISLAVIPIIYVLHPDAFPNQALAEIVVLLGGLGGSLLASLSAGVLGSRWWFVAAVAVVVDTVCLWGFSP